MNKTIKLKVNANIHGYYKGDTVIVKVDSNGVPLDINWRRRLKDSMIDNCVEIISSEKKQNTDKGKVK